MSDAPKINSTMADLDSAAKAGSFRQALKGGKIITFPDIGEMGWIEAEEFAQDLMGAQSSATVMKKWLSEADYKKLLDAKLNLYQMNELGRRVMTHYESILGNQGNAPGSTES